MIGRIGSGVKCSASLMSVHFSDNPGVSIAVKSYLQVRLSAMPPEPPETDITNQWIESGSTLESKMAEQMGTHHAEQSLLNDTLVLREMNRRKYDGQHKPSNPNAK